MKAKIAGAVFAAPLFVFGLSAGAAPEAGHTGMDMDHMGAHYTGRNHMAAAEHLPPARTQVAISYVSGGVGDDEAAAMKQAARDYPVEMEFLQRAQPRDEYLADIKVEVKDQHDKTVLDTTSAGPFLLAKLPAGRYTVMADRGDKVEKRTVKVDPHAHQRIVFEWGQG
jgi:hypothetical protein